ncbi:type I-F CRISPR-associated helicase Cas3f [Methylomicrobium album]|uniref:CRISPR-associated helicase Cas3, subtype I-F/YPEST n=1 Tax=Methylomicrobium album BG8 TaxID=686340 RepID=H8GLE3_METAL|nr:type I-F CRISPR-associated helicase Cas3f [Methylomicrobium album]EIC29308.1 CRISPR-associated helicase Cas3, subtype I-F/YPEST [Methylomicrobium album BG8]
MMVTFVSQCEKNALDKTRRVLDSFANRIGDRTWQTVITQDGLDAVRKLLRKTASKNTAVACHWLRSRGRSELVWIVGNRSRFNAQGIVPVNTTRQEIAGRVRENDWHDLPLIKTLAALAALFHDWGKASLWFQQKLRAKKPPDPLRHEWVSVLLLAAMIDGEPSDAVWLKRLAEGVVDETALAEKVRSLDDKPMAALPDVACLIAWLVVTHHKLPDFKSRDVAREWRSTPAESLQQALKRITAVWAYRNEAEANRQGDCLTFSDGLLAHSQAWLEQLKKWAGELLARLPQVEAALADGSYRLLLHHARLCLMLGDHQYSSQDADGNWPKDLPLFANTDKNADLKQRLDEHLVRVGKCATTIARRLPLFESDPPPVYDVKRLKKKSTDKRFRWQDQAVDKIKAWKTEANADGGRYGFFAVNMASTGSGKTLANAKIMQSLSEGGDSLRYVLALGLRTLTLQTGDEYRSRIGLDNSELAVMIGSRAVLELHTQAQQGLKEDASANQQGGSESAEALWEDNEVDFDIPEEALSALGTVWTDRSGRIDKRKQKFLYAPVLACTVDHLMAATETRRGGRYILPCLRLMSSDLVIDEIDDFDGDDLVAIGRLIHLAGMLGRKVMISSATIPPDLAEGYFNAYRSGWRLFAQSRRVKSQIGCTWIDEFDSRVRTLQNADLSGYRQAHAGFIEKRCANLQNPDKTQVKRIGEMVECPGPGGDLDGLKQSYFAAITQTIVRLHCRHAFLEPDHGKRVSFGVVRMANVTPCVELARYLAAADWPEGIDIRVMAYHSRQVLLLRHHQERHLDDVLKRNRPDAGCNDPVIRRHLHESLAENLIFILVATPVEEVGRDHDFDWAVVEPSSYRSIIQLAGRVLRHRELVPSEPNIALLRYNLRALLGADGEPAYCYPGYEDKNNRLNTHDLSELIPATQLSSIDALPRIRCSPKPQPGNNLADLEHRRIQSLLTAYAQCGPESLQGWLDGCWWLTGLPQNLTPFRQQTCEQTLYDVPDEKGNSRFVEKTREDGINTVEKTYKVSRVELTGREKERWWLHRDYRELLEQQAEKSGLSLLGTALRYGEINVEVSEKDINNGKRFAYGEQLGFWKIDDR